jgi:predicted nucleic-acid-binding protein
MMKITVDTNILLRVLVQDDRKQAQVAAKLLREAVTIAVGLPCLCELVWVLREGYKYSTADTSLALRTLLGARNVQVKHAAVQAGLDMLEAGGEFADGVIAYEGAWLGGETFVSFDKKAVSLLARQGISAKLLA